MEPEPQSFKAFVTAAILVAMLLNLTLLLPVSPVRAESEGQTCTSCSCCQRPRVAETFHHVTVNIVDEEILLQIEPLILQRAYGWDQQNSKVHLDRNIRRRLIFTVLQPQLFGSRYGV